MTAALAIRPEIDAPQVVFEELISAITLSIEYNPRSLQTVIGPSEIGEECPRALIARLAGMPKPVEPPNWKARVGTAVHVDLAGLFPRPRWLTETRVNVGGIAGRRIGGSVDLFDTETGTVIDWKTKSRLQMQNHRRNGPGRKYIVQMQLYGVGMAAAGWPVRQVMNVFLPRDGELADAFHWADAFDPAVAIAALARAEELSTLAAFLGPEVAMEQFPYCQSEWCRSCTTFRKIRPGSHRPVADKDNPFGLPF